MVMALKADVIEACRKAGTAKPIDLVHLSNQTMGDRELELEVLKLFAAQIPQYLELANVATKPDEISRAAHTIKGVARSVGAVRLTEIAIQAETSGGFDLTALRQEFKNITNYIAELISNK